MQDFTQFIRPELMVLVPVLFFIGVGLKRSCRVRNCNIPLLLGVCGVALTLLYMLGTSRLLTWQAALKAAFTAITQGILCAGCSVYVHQIIKQKHDGKN